MQTREKLNILPGILFLFLFIISAGVSAQNAPALDQPVDVTGIDASASPVSHDVNLTGITDNDGGTQTISLSASSDNQILIPDGNITINYTSPNSTGTLTFTPAANEYGIANITVTVTDPDGSASQSFTVSVNGPPTAADTTFTTNEDTQLQVNAPGFIGNDTDPENDPLSATLVSDVSRGSLTFYSNGSFIYTPDANTNNTNGPVDYFTYKVSDGSLESNTATVTINVVPVNDAPVAVNDTFTVNEDTQLSIAATGVLLNDSDVESTTLTATLSGSPGHGTLTLDSEGSFTYDPSPNYSGTDQFTYTASDPDGLISNTATVTIFITEVNDPPVAVNDTTIVAEGGAVTVNVVSNDSDVDGSLDNTSIVITSQSNGSAVSNNNGTVTFTHDGSETTSASFSYTINDNIGATSNIATVIINVTPQNDPPVADDDTVTVSEGESVILDVISNDYDVDGTLDSASIITSNAINGTAVSNTDGTVTFTHNGSETTTASFTYTINDNEGLTSNQATVNITVNPVNDPPTAQAETYTATEDTPLNVDAGSGVLQNDSDPENGTLTANLVNDVTSGTLSLNGDGSFSYNPDPDFDQSDLFTYYVSDNGGLNSDTVAVTITVTPVNDPPSFSSNNAVSIKENETNVITVTTTDPENDTITYSLPATGDNSLFTIDSNTGALAFISAPNYENPTDANSDSVYVVTVVATDDGTPAESSSQVINVRVTNVNEPPVATNDSYTTSEDTALTVSAPGVLVNDSDEDTNDTLSVVVQTNPGNGTLTLNSDGSFVYTPNENYSGSDSFTYTASDGSNSSNIATVNISVGSVNDPPVAKDDSYPVNEDEVLTVDNTTFNSVLFNDTDADGNTLSATVLSTTTHGTLSLGSDGTFTYTPNANFAQTDTFTYVASDGFAGGTDTATVFINVTPVNDAPIASTDTFTIDEDLALTIAAPGVLANDSDIEGSALTAVYVAGPDSGSVNLQSTGAFTYTPNTNFNGTDRFSYSASDGQLLSTETNVVITVNAVNDAPVFTSSNTVSVSENHTGNILDVNASDPEKDTITYSLPANTGDNNAFSINSTTGELSFITPPDFENPTDQDGNNIYLATIMATDDGTPAESSTQTITVTVNGVNEAPVATDDTYETDEDTPLSGNVISNDNDPEGDNLKATLGSDNVTHGTLTLSDNGSFTYTPATNFYGTDNFTYTVNDGTFDSNEATVTITVISVNDAPVITSADAITVDENQTSVITVTTTDTEGDSISYSVDTGTGDGALFTINGVTGELTFTNAPDYENPADQDGNNTYLVTVTATDDGTPAQSTSQLITVTVNDINEGAPVFSSATSISVQENQTSAITVLAADPEGNDVTYSLPAETNDNDLFTVVPSTGVLTFNTAPDFESPSDGNGDNNYIITVIASDNQAQPLTSTQTITITVTDVNEGAPVFSSPANVSVNENQTSALTATATDPEGNEVTYLLPAGTNDNDNDLFTIDAASGVLSFISAPDFENPGDSNSDNNYVVYVEASDNQSSPLISTQVITITVNDINETPIAVADTFNTSEDTQLIITNSSEGVLGNDTDPENTALTATLFTDVTNGTLEFNNDGTFTYTPVANSNDTVSFTYSASDGPNTSNPVSVTINIVPVNDPPNFISSNAVSYDENATGVVIDVNATDPENDNITFSLALGQDDNNLFSIDPSTGEITFISSPDYESPADQNGDNVYLVSVTATDTGTPVQSATQTISVTVVNVNESPVFTSSDTVTIRENQISALTVTTSDPDDNSTITYSLPSTGDNSLFTIDASTGDLSFRVAPDFESPTDANRDNIYMVTVDATDDGYPAITTSQVISITVTNINEIPVAVNDSYETSEDTELAVDSDHGVLRNDDDDEGTSLTAKLQDDVSHGTLTFNPNGSFTYIPDANFNGSDLFTYTASDSVNTSDIATVNISVGSVNDPPVANGETYTTSEDITLTADASSSVLLNDTDPDGNALTAVQKTTTTNGTLTFNENDGTFTYVPEANFFGTDSFTYAATDGFIESNPATVTIKITSVNDAPFAGNDTATVDEGGNVAINIITNDSDVDGTLDLTSVLFSNITNGTVSYDDNGTVTFTHNGSETLTAGFSYTINDNQGAVSNQASVTITVNPVNDLPVAANDSAVVNEGESVDINLVSNDTDADGTLNLSSIVVTNVTNGTFVDNGNGIITFTHDGSETTTAGFSYTINDDDGGTSNQATVLFRVNPVNDAPVFTSADVTSIDENQTNVIAIETTDAENNNITYSLPASDDNSLFAINSSTGILTFINAPDYENPLDSNHDNEYIVTVRATDDGTPLQQSANQTIYITVLNVNEAPVVNNDLYTIFEDNPLVTTATNGILANDNDPDNDTLSITIQNNVAHGTLQMNNDGSFTYTPVQDYNGSDLFTYTVNDGTVNSSLAVVSITITSVNDAPQANDDAYSVDEDTPLSVSVADGVLINDTDPDSKDLNVSLQTNVSHGSLTLSSDGSFIYTPTGNFNGTDQFNYTVSDGIATSGIATVTITVNSINDVPVAQDDSYSTNEDTPLTVDADNGVLNNDSDPDNDTLIVVLQNDVAHGTLTLNQNGSFTYTPGQDYNGSDSFTYYANDGTASSSVVTVYITIISQNDNPVAINDTTSVNEGETTPNPINIVANDYDVDGNLDYTSINISNVTNGSVVNNQNGTITFTHDGSETTTAGFSYTIQDNQGAISNVAQVVILVTQSNDNPIAKNDSASVNEGQSVVINVTINDTDPDGTLDLSSIIFSNQLNGTCVNNNDGTVTFTHDGSETTVAGFSYTINDDLGATSNVAHVAIEVNPQNDPPIATDDEGTVNEGGSTTINIVSNDHDADGTLNLNSIFIGNVNNGITVDNGDGTVTFTHNGSETTTAGFAYTINDDQGAVSNMANVIIDVVPVNDAPVFTSSETASINENQTDVLTVTTTDAESDTITYSLDSSDDNALFAVNSVSGELSFLSAPDYEDPQDADRNNEYIVNITATDNGSPAQSTVQQITITVLNVNEAPVANDDVYNSNEDDTLQVAVPGVIFNDTDQENDTLTAYLQNNVTHGNLSFNSDGSFRYIPEANYNGTDQFNYYVSDGNTMSTVASVTLNIIPQNDAPVGNDDTYNTSEDRTLIINSPGILANDVDIDGNSLTATLISGTTNGTLTLNPDGSFTYQPNTNYSGIDSFIYAANDGNLLSDSVTVTINVGETNDAPVSENDSYSTTEDIPLTIDMPGILDNDNDPDNNSLSAVLVNNVSHGVLALNTNGSFTYTPNENYNGFDSFTYQASDGQITGNTATVTITIQAANDAPVALNDNIYTAENTPDNINVTINDSDPYDEPDGGIDDNSIAIVMQPKHGTAFPIGNKINYTPFNGFYGNDTLSYEVYDTGYPLPALSDTAMVFIKVARRSPLAVNDSVSLSEDNNININVLANDQDIDIDPKTVNIGTPPNHGTVTVDESTGVVTYDPALNYFGPDGFTYTVKDMTGLTSNIASVVIDVIAVPDPPVTTNGNYSTPEDVELSIRLDEIASDPDNDLDYSSVEFVDDPVHGTVSNNSVSHEMTYTPNNGFSGTDTFTFRISDLNGTVSNTSTVTITVSNEAPNAQNDSYTIDEDQISEFDVLNNDTDPQNNIISDSVKITAEPLHGIASVNSGGTITYTPEKDYFGTDNFTYKVTDATNYSDQAQVNIEITPVNDPPVAVNDTVTFKEDQTGELSIDILRNDFDIDNQIDSASVTIFRAPVHGQVEFNTTTYEINYTPEANFFGNDSLKYGISDIAGATSQGSVFITVLPVEDPPQPQDDYISTNEETEVIYNVLLNDADVENDIDSCSITILTQPQNGILSVLDAPNCGKISYTPSENFLGKDMFIYQISDTTGLTGQATVYVTVNNTPDPPVASNDNYSIPEDSVLIMNVLKNDVDPDNNIDSSRLSIVEYPQNGSVEISNNRIVYVPATNYFGNDVFRYQVCDSTNLCDSAYVYINITPVNDPPVAYDDYGSTTNQPLRIDVASNDIDVDGNLDLFSIIVITSPQHGNTNIENGTGFIVYTPDDIDYYGPDSFVYRICDTRGACDTATVYLEITSGNVAPVTQPDYVTTDEDTPVNIQPAGNDTDPNNNLDITSITIVDGPKNGIATLDAMLSQIIYEPALNFNGTDTIVYSICDSGEPSMCSNGMIYITVNPVNDSPDAGDIAIETFDNSSVDIDVLSYCTDPENDLLSVSISEYSPDIHGTATVNPDGSIHYVAAEGIYCTTDQIVYKVCDPSGACDSASIIVSLDPVDSDGDNIPDNVEGNIDPDNDGVPNYLDDDSDGDNIPDYIESGIQDPCTDTLADTDGDSIDDFIDQDSDNDGYPDKEEGYEDCDNDGIPNYIDAEDDCVERIDVPDTFSPNGDGINDYFWIPGANDLQNDELYIYNRWGGLVYHSKDYDNTWDGKSDNSTLGSSDLQEGTYFYIYKPGNSINVFKGTVYLKR